MIKIIPGDILENNEVYVVQQCDCISTVAQGLDAEYAEEYPFANVYGDRTQLKGFRNLAVPGDRAVPGDIKVYNAEDKDDPHVIAIFSQYCPGRPFTGINAKKRFKDDTEQNRIKWFKECLEKITLLNVNSIAFPYKVGCLRNGGDWEVYSDALQDFSDKNPESMIYLYNDPFSKEK